MNYPLSNPSYPPLNLRGGIYSSTIPPLKLRGGKGELFFGEGNTPLVRLFNLEEKLNWRGEIWTKCEYLNPTGSFKDRGSVAEIQTAIEQKMSGVVCASTGNMAASLAAYAARANLKCLVVVPQKTPETKLRQAIVCGAKLIKTDGGYDECVKAAKQLAAKLNYLLCGDYKTRRIGQRSIGREIAQVKINFDAFIVPVGNGTLGCAISEGFAEYNQYPEFWGVQGIGADPLSQAWKNSTQIKSVNNPQTIATAMNVGNPLDGKLTLEWVRKTNGVMLSVSDVEILAAQKLLAKTEGIYVESAAAAAIAGLKQITKKRNGQITKNIVLILTGSGLKEK